MKIPVAKPYLTNDEAQAAYDTIMSGWITQGPKVEEFEKKFAEYVGTNYAVAISNCTTALHLSLKVLGIKEGDEVICPSMSYIATANAIVHAGAKPIFAEVDNDYNISLQHASKLITPKTKAILIVHQLGFPADIEGFSKLCKENNIALVEDAACAAGSIYQGKKIGSHSDLVCFSFHPRKLISTGDGGMISTNNKYFHNRLKILRQHGMSVNDRLRHESAKVIFEEYLEVGYNYRLTDIQAAVGIKQLEKLDWVVKERRRIAKLYFDELKNIKGIRLPQDNVNSQSNFQSFSIYLEPTCKIERDELMQKLLDIGISTRRGVMCSHREKAYENTNQQLQLPISEDLQDRSIIIPLYVPMNSEEIFYVINKLKEFLE